MKTLKSIYRFLKLYKCLVFFCLLLVPISGRMATAIFNISTEYTTGYYYQRAKPLPQDIKECLYKVYKDKKFVDKLRYLVSEDFFFTDDPYRGISLGNLVVIEGKEHISYSLLVHEVAHSQQIKKYGKTYFLIKYLYQLIKYGYNKMPLEKEAKEKEGDCY